MRFHAEQYWAEKVCQDVVRNILAMPDEDAIETYEYSKGVDGVQNLDDAYTKVLSDATASIIVLMALSKERTKR